MARITIHYDELEQHASSLNGARENYESLLGRLAALRGKIADGWEGAASDLYRSKLEEYEKEARKLVEVLERFKGYANNASTRFAGVDQQCAAMIRNSFN